MSDCSLQILSEDFSRESRIFDNCYILCEQRDDFRKIQDKAQDLGGRVVSAELICVPTNEALHELTHFIEELVLPIHKKCLVITANRRTQKVCTFEKTNHLIQCWDLIVSLAKRCDGTIDEYGFDFPNLSTASHFIGIFCRDFIF